MEKEVVITITGIQTGEDGTKDSQTAKQKGQYFKKNDKSYIFVEDEVTAENSRYVFNHRGIEILRNGDIAGKLVFEVGKSHEAVYRTPYGKMPLVFNTSQYSLMEKKESISIEITYAIYNDGVLISNNVTQICIEQLTSLNNF